MMLFSSLLVAVSCIAVASEAKIHKRFDGGIISTRQMPQKRAPSPIVITDAVIPLKKSKTRAGSNRHSALLTAVIGNGSTTSISSLEIGEEFATSVTIGGQTFELIIDTGSSDTWVVETGFSCTDFATGEPAAESACLFGPYYTKSSTFKQISGETFSIEYGDLESLTGIIGTEDVTVAGIEVVGQTIAVVTAADWEGDGTTSGLMGLAYPDLTSAYKGSTQEVYNPIFTSMYKAGDIANDYFSLLIERDTSGPSGYLAFGGVPDIAFTQNFTSTPIIITNVQGYPDGYDFYSININSITLSGSAISSSGGSSYTYIIDSGTTLNYVPNSVATKINAAYSPKATYSSSEGAYVVSCTAKPPAVSVNIAGTLFPINPLDMILQTTDGNGNTICITGWTQGGTGAENIYILGDVFQKNVVSLFDVGAGTMQFAGREFYSSDDTVKRESGGRRKAKRSSRVQK